MKFFVEVSFFDNEGIHFLLSKSFDSSYESSLWVVSHLDQYSEFHPVFDIYEYDDEMEDL